MESVDVFGTIEQWAKDAWSAGQNVARDIESAVDDLWSFASSVLSGLATLAEHALEPLAHIVYDEADALLTIIRDTRDAVDRVAWWVDTYLLEPVRATLQLEINTLRAAMLLDFQNLTYLVELLHAQETAYINMRMLYESQDRVAGDAFGLANTQAAVTALHQTIEKEAVAGYAAGQGIRSNMIQQLASDLNVRGLLDTASTDILIKAVDVLVDIDDPELAAVANKIVSEIIKKSGIGDDLGDLIDRLIQPGPGGAKPKDLTGVIADITYRIGQLEGWISNFMLKGGPEVEDAGSQWKTLNSLIVDAGLLAFFAQAVADPAAWATEVADTVGVVANGALGSIVDLISHA